jgi:hypothetical protein
MAALVAARNVGLLRDHDILDCRVGEGNAMKITHMPPSDKSGPVMAKSACCGAPLERRNDGKLYCSECGSFQGS